MASNGENGPESGVSGTGGNATRNEEEFVPSEETVAEAKRLTKEIWKGIEEGGKVWGVATRKQLTIAKMLFKMAVSEKFRRDFHKAWGERGLLVSQCVEGMLRFTEINERVENLSQRLEEFETEINKASQIVRDFSKKIREHMITLQNAIDPVADARTMEELAGVEIPKLDWVASFPDPEIEMLEVWWADLNLSERISQCIGQLEELLSDYHQDNDAIDGL